MDNISICVQLLLLIALVKYALKAAMTRHVWSIFLYALVAAAMALAVYPVVINQPTNVISLFLKHAEWVADGAVLTTLEAVTGVFASVYLLSDYIQPRKRARWASIFIRVFPGYMAFAAVFFFELQFFRMRLFDDFLSVAIAYASLMLVGISAVGVFFYQVINHYPMRLELKLLLDLTMLFIGLFVHCMTAEYRSSDAIVHIDWWAMLAFVGIVLTCVVLGYFLYHIPWKRYLMQRLTKQANN